ncbi:hypothetical protein Hanom_Chr05g00469751 [Helianthus anomalus]
MSTIDSIHEIKSRSRIILKCQIIFPQIKPNYKGVRGTPLSYVPPILVCHVNFPLKLP